jgi:hypothetical protein
MRRQGRSALGVMVLLVLAISLGPLIVGLVQLIRVPPAQHPGLVVFGLFGGALERLIWSLGLAAFVLIARAVTGAIRSRTSGTHRWVAFPRFQHQGLEPRVERPHGDQRAHGTQTA